MKSRITGKVLLHFAILVVLSRSCCCGLSLNVTHPSALNYSTHLPSTAVQYGSYNVTEMTLSTPATLISGLNTKITVAPSSLTGINEPSHPGSTLRIDRRSATLITSTSSKEFMFSTHSFTKQHSASQHKPTAKTPHSTTKNIKKSKPVLHKVGLVIGVVSGLVFLCLCLIVFHKKEARLRCLKLLCKPCTKNYSRYNIVPIYVYDDNEQDIHELQDDSDLPLV